MDLILGLRYKPRIQIKRSVVWYHLYIFQLFHNFYLFIQYTTVSDTCGMCSQCVSKYNKWREKTFTKTSTERCFYEHSLAGILSWRMICHLNNLIESTCNDRYGQGMDSVFIENKHNNNNMLHNDIKENRLHYFFNRRVYI